MTKNETASLIKNIEDSYKVKVLYITLYGSRLYGTQNENSDKDYKFIFIPSEDDILLKKDLDHIKIGKDTKEKNTKFDVDIDGLSVHKFFTLLRKGETGALDILFSMWSDVIVYEDQDFAERIKSNYTKFLNRNLHSFIGYSVGMSKKYGIKGTRYKELEHFVSHFEDQRKFPERKLEELFDLFELYFKKFDTKYLLMTESHGPKTGQGLNMIPYVELLGKKFSGDVSVGYFLDRVDEQFEQFGNRTKSSVEGVDWKALSHSVRVILEVEELLDTGFITFPLIGKKWVSEVKEGNVPIEAVMLFINAKLDEVKEKLETSDLPEYSNRVVMDELELLLIRMHSANLGVKTARENYTNY